MLRLTQPSDPHLQRILERSSHTELSYEEVGATKTGPLPAGYRHDNYERRLGAEEDLFGRAVRALRSWQSYLGAGVRIFPDGATVEIDGTVLFVLRAAGLWAIMPCRVVYIVDEPSTFSFGYGTLPGHAERGEVAMSVSSDDAGSVVARIDSFSRTIDPLARAASPLTRVVQKVTNRYLEALAAASARPPAGHPHLQDAGGGSHNTS